MTKMECAVIEAYTGVVMLEGKDRYYFYRYLEKLLGRKVLTHQIPELMSEIKERSRADFEQICKEALDDDRF